MIGGQRGLAGAGQAEEHGAVAVLADVGGAVHGSSALSCSSDDDGGGNGGTQLEWLEPIRVASYNIPYDLSLIHI